MAGRDGTRPRFAAALSTDNDPLRAVAEACRRSALATRPSAADLGFVFVSAQFSTEIARLAARVCRANRYSLSVGNHR